MNKLNSQLADTLSGKPVARAKEDSLFIKLKKYIDESLDALLSLMTEQEGKRKSETSQIIKDEIEPLAEIISKKSETTVSSIAEQPIIAPINLQNSDKQPASPIAEQPASPIAEQPAEKPLTKAQELRREDELKEEAIEQGAESMEIALDSSETMADIGDSLLELKTSVKVLEGNLEESNSSFMDIFGWLGGSIGKVSKFLVGGLGKILGFVARIPGISHLIGFVKTGVTKALKVLSPIKSFIAKRLSALAGTILKPITSLKAFISSHLKKILALIPSPTKLLSKAKSFIPKMFTKSASKSAAKVATKSVGKTVTKTLAKSAGKSLIKKIPLLGALAGLGFSIPRLLKGDFVGASMELASGVASTLPIVGTAGSVALDVALAARDINNSQEPTKAPIELDNAASRKIINQESKTVNESSSDNYSVHTQVVNQLEVSKHDSDLLEISGF